MITRAYAMAGLVSILGFANLARADVAPDCTDVGAFPSSVTVTVGGRPESIQWDPVSGYWYQGNQGSQASATDGYISRINADFTVDNLFWATGFGNLTGIRIFDGKIYGADSLYQTAGRQAIVVVDVATGQLDDVYDIPNSILNGGNVNDPVVDPSTRAIYVSDRHATNIDALTTVLKVDLATGAVSNVAPPGSFGRRPNGVLHNQHGLVVVNTDGVFWRVELGRDGNSVAPLGTSSYIQLDGLERLGDSFLATQNGGGPFNAVTNPVLPTIGILFQIRFRPDGTQAQRPLCILQPLEQAADIGVDPGARIVAIPHLNKGKVTFVSLDDLL